jgi:aspartate-semialdehyde dehydrogenase
MRIAIVGATGLVGREMMEVLEERNFPVDELIPVASAKSVGKELSFKNRTFKIIGMKDAIALQPDIALFSAGGSTSLEWAPELARVNTTVIDNSSAWRMDPDKKLIIPEINGHELTKSDKIIANPNCSTIQMLVALAPLHKAYNIRRVVVSTYQSITGTGKDAVVQMENERAGNNANKVYPWPIDKNCLPHCDVFLESGYTKEEQKMISETHKILDPAIRLTATAVRVPVMGGHSEAINLEFETDFKIEDIFELFDSTEGIVVQDDLAKNLYPMPLHSRGKDDVFVGRIRRDHSRENCLNLWVVSDNLRKGAATNAIQIAELLLKRNLV